jgi:pimeloyl-ACP methyl ester carboxylesterase
MEEGLEFFMDDVAGDGSWKNASDLSKQMYRDNAWTVKGVANDEFEPYSCADARRVQAPTLLICGEKSPAFRATTLDAVQACLGYSERAVVRNAAHSMPQDNPRGFSEAVLAFVNRH